LSVLEYLDRTGTSPFAAWFQRLDAAAAAKATTALRRLEPGRPLERKRRRGWRVRVPHRFLAWVSRVLWQGVVILLCGGTKKRQDRDVAMAHDQRADYKKRKAEEK
jgi:putative component of toxin-antitoxin plasmid stabilization module